LLTITPQADIAFLLDAVPEKARERKPEYPVDFLRQSRAAYLALSEMGGGMNVIGPLPVGEAADQILEATLKKLSPGDLHYFSTPAQSVARTPNLG